MKRRISSALALAAGITAPQHLLTVDASSSSLLIDDHHLRVRPEMEDELRGLNHGEFAPLVPNAHTRHLVEERRQRRPPPRQGREQGERSVEECSSPLVDWSTEQIYEMGYDTYKTLYENKIIQMPYVYKHYIDKNEYEEFFVSGDQTRELQRRHRDTIKFWKEADIDGSILDTDDILLLSMHGNVLEDNDKLVPTIMRIFDFDSTADVMAFASKVQNIVKKLPGSYNNPLLTMNAVATRSTYNHGTFNGHDDSSRRVKDSILIGDGVLKFIYDTGLETSGPDFVHAHEFGHHLQFRLDMAVPPGSAFVHDDRRKELMADAISGYFLAHDKGGDMMVKEIGVFDRAAFATGDCSTESEDHHGTPKQRQCAAIWGASLAAPDHVPVLDPEVFVRSFDQAYMRMLSLDEAVCSLIQEETSVDYHEEEQGRLPSVQVIEVANWDNNNAGYNEDEKINLGDWLDAQDREPTDQAWEDPFETKYEWSDSNEQQPASNQDSVQDPFETKYEWSDSNEQQPASNQDIVPIPNQDVVSLVPIDNNSWESRGQPSSVAGLRPGTRPNGGGEREEADPYRNYADRGRTPEETNESYMQNAVTVRDCHMPWVYCQGSSSSSRNMSAMIGLVSVFFAFGVPIL